MKLKWGLFSIFCFIGIAILAYWSFWSFHQTEHQKVPHLKDQYGQYFISIPVANFSKINTPVISLQLEDMTLPVGIDLGFRGALSLPNDILDKLSKKTFRLSKPMWDFRGQSHELKVYDIPEVSIGQLLLFNTTAQEDTLAFCNNASIPKPGQDPSPDTTARIGWEPFVFSNLFLDLANSQIAFCDGIDTLQKHGYFLEHCIQTPLFIDRGLIECDALTSNGSLRCVLDTGSTWNILHTVNPQKRPIEELAWSPEHALNIASFKIAGQELGPLQFARFPIQLPIHIDAILGMDFFLKHLVFIDFYTEQIYFAPSIPRTSL